MIALNVTDADIMKMRFAFSPMVEAVTSFHMLNHSKHPSQYLQWIDEANRALHDVKLPYMVEMIAKRSHIPDFLTPTPTAPMIDLEEELRRLCETPATIIEDHIRLMIDYEGESELLMYALAHPYEAVCALVEEIRTYWERTLAHHWVRLTAILENDILYRAREQALYGAEQMLNGLHPRLSYDDGALYIEKSYKNGIVSCTPTEYAFDITGRGLQIVPMIFSFPKLFWQVGETYQPMVIYGARGTGLWHYAEPDNPDEALQVTLGIGRSKVFYALTTPRSTSELAYLLEITAGAVSQHLSKLNQAGLVESSRSGKRVFYRLSQRGQKLIELFS